MSGGTAEPIKYNTTGDVERGTTDLAMTEQFIDHDFVVDRKPTQEEVQIYKESLESVQFRNTLWMDMAVTKFWNRTDASTCGYLRDLVRGSRFPFLWLLAMSLMVYFPIILINKYWPSGVECLRDRHAWTIIFASEAVIIYLCSMTGFNKWTLSDESKQVRNQSTWLLYLMLSSYSTRHKWVIILGHIADVVCRGFLIPATAWSLIYNDPELEQILIKGVEMHFLMEIPHVLRYMSEDRMVDLLVSTYERKGARVANYDTWQQQNKCLIGVTRIIESGALLWSVILPILILFCM